MSIKRYAIAAGAAALVFSGVYGAAASLGVEGGALQTGSDDVLVCDNDGVTVDSYLVDAEPPAVSNGVKISGVSDECAGRTLFATVTGDGVQKRGSATVATGGTVNVRWDAPVDAESITAIDITIE